MEKVKTNFWHDIRFDHRVIFDYSINDRCRILHWVESNIGSHTKDWIWLETSQKSFFYFKTEENKVKFALRWA